MSFIGGSQDDMRLGNTRYRVKRSVDRKSAACYTYKARGDTGHFGLSRSAISLRER